MSCIIYTVNCNSTTHVICPLTLTTYKYDELQVVIATQKLSYKASCKRPLILIMCIIILLLDFIGDT
jgi:hypothetical protein